MGHCTVTVFYHCLSIVRRFPALEGKMTSLRVHFDGVIIKKPVNEVDVVNIQVDCNSTAFFHIIEPVWSRSVPHSRRSDVDYISEIGWVNIHVVGVDAIKDVLIKLPQGESVFWCDESRIRQTMEQINLQLPSKLIVDVIREQADSCGLDLVIASS